MSGLMVVERISLLLLALRLLVLVCIVWGTAEEYRLERCRAFLPVPGIMQTVSTC